MKMSVKCKKAEPNSSWMFYDKNDNEANIYYICNEGGGDGFANKLDE